MSTNKCHIKDKWNKKNRVNIRSTSSSQSVSMNWEDSQVAKDDQNVGKLSHSTKEEKPIRNGNFK